MAKQISKTDAEYLKSHEAWLKTQNLSIKSCELAIKQANENISHQQERIRLERAELAAKIRVKEAAIQQVAEFKKNLK